MKKQYCEQYFFLIRYFSYNWGFTLRNGKEYIMYFKNDKIILSEVNK